MFKRHLLDSHHQHHWHHLIIWQLAICLPVPFSSFFRNTRTGFLATVSLQMQVFWHVIPCLLIY